MPPFASVCMCMCDFFEDVLFEVRRASRGTSPCFFPCLPSSLSHLFGGRPSILHNQDRIRSAPGLRQVVCVKNDLGLPRDPALRTQEVIKRLRMQGVPLPQMCTLFGAG